MSDADKENNEGSSEKSEKTENSEKSEKTGEKGRPEAWKDIPIDAYLDEGYKPRIKTVAGRKYIVLSKGKQDVGLGPYSDENWEILMSMVKEGAGAAQGAEAEKEGDADKYVQAAIQGITKGEGYLQELKNMIRAQVSRTRELNEFVYNVGLGLVTAALSKSGVGIDEFRKIALEGGRLNEALAGAAETAFKALEYYQQDAIRKLEEERDEARVAYSMVAAQLNSLMKDLDPKIRLEKMIHAYLLSGHVDPDALTTLINKWLGMELNQVREELMA